MIYSVIVAVLVSISIILLILFKPNIKVKNINISTFFIPALIGAIILLIFNIVPVKNVFDAFTSVSSVNPIKILLLFISIALISISLDELGFFKYIAIKALNKCHNNQYVLFFILYALVAVLTIFTSNDIIILTFTPFIVYFAKHAKINAIPYLIMEFITANTYSMLFTIGNPTNIYLSSYFNISFLDYFKVMYLPTLLAGLSSLIILLLIFNKDLHQAMDLIDIEEVKIDNKPLMIINLIHLGVTIILLAISNYIHFEMWIICLCAALSLTIFLISDAIIHKSATTIKHVYKRLPYNLIPFVLSMFIIVLALDYNEVTVHIAEFLNSISSSKNMTIFNYLLISTISDNLINNIPMSVLFASILTDVNNHQLSAIYATIIGSNIGAYLTPIGALAGIMWMSLLKKYDIKFTFFDFMKYGVIIVPAILLMSLLGLMVNG